MSFGSKNFCLLLGISEDIDRAGIRNEFGQFGRITKIFLKDDFSFAKIYFEEQESCRKACRALSNNTLGWIVEQGEDTRPPARNNNSSQFAGKLNNTFGGSNNTQSNPNSSRVVASEKTNMYDYLEDEFTENVEYCDIHGNPLVVFQADSGAVYVNVKDVRRAGFAIFRRDSFNQLLLDRRQIQKEFELHLLSEAKNYILKNKAIAVDEDAILKTIERCKNKLLGEQTQDNNRSVNQTSNNTFQRPERIEWSQGGFESFTASSPIAPQRAPKNLPSNFMPTTTQRNSKPWTGGDQRQRQNNFNRESRDMNGFQDEFKKPYSNRGRQDNNGSGTHSVRARSKSKNRDDMSQTSEGSERRRKYADVDAIDKIDKVELQIGNTYEVKVSHIDKENICWVQEKESSVELDNMLIKLFDLAPEVEDLSDPSRGQLVLAMFEDVWCRARVFDVNSLYVHFIDYGNKSHPDSVKAFPEELRKIPALALRVVLNGLEKPLESDLELKIRIKQKYQDGTYIAEVEEAIPKQTKEAEKKDAEKPVRVEKPIEKVKVVEESKPVEEKKPETPKKVEDTRKEEPVEQKKVEAKSYFGVPEPMSTLKNGDKVMLIDLEGNRFGVKTREAVNKSKELIEYIKKLDKSNLHLTGVKEGQLVLCSRDSLPNLYRAVIKKKTSAVAVTVKYLDYIGEDQLAIKSLRNVDEYLATQPVTLLSSPESKMLENLGPKALDFVTNLLEKKEKAKIVISENGDFDLQLEDGSLLTQKLLELGKDEAEKKEFKLIPVKKSPTKVEQPKAEAPSPAKVEKPKAVAPEYTPVVYDDMDWIKIKVDTTDSYLCYTIKDLKDLTLISLQDESMNNMAKVTDLTALDDAPYEPAEFEMCLVAHQAPEEDEPSWYRGVVLERNDGEYNIQAVDFGNLILAKSKDVRKFTKELQKIPILGITCEFVGIPDSEAVLERVKQLIPEGEEIKVDIKSFDDLKYKIEIPSVYKILKQEGLC
ncbi:hypothetical protein JTB14_010157 [Gonioctena quinquepunctata]|nr:hypothetical protein JTB14_010157 [Gonioctena quinquepunctata]